MTDNVSGCKVRSPLDVARGYLAAGISVIPIRRDGSKAPTIAWKDYTRRLPTEAELRRWFEGRNPPGLATVGGAVSGCLEHLDFDRDAAEVFPAWCRLVDDECPGLVDRLTIAQTPRGGYHVRYRSPDEDIAANTKLAVAADKQTIIETRGEGGYCLAPGSPPDCHETGRPYVHKSGPVIPPAITPDERETLWCCARSFTRDVNEPPRMKGLDLRPGDDYNRRGPDWPDIIGPAGWRCVFGSPSSERRWCRPGKERGCSATTGHCRGQDGADLLRVFSSNAPPFEAKCYSKFTAYAAMNHNGDLSAAAETLAKQGYGRSAPRGAPSSRARPSPVRSFLPYQPFPVQLLPAAVRGYVSATAAALGCDPGFVALPVLAVIAAAIGGTRTIRLKHGWEEPAILWTVMIGESGTLKSPAWSKAVGRLFRIQHRFFEEFKADRAQHANELTEWKAAQRDARKGGRSPGDRPEPPILRRVICSDTTVEKLAEILEDNPRGLLVTRDELAGWIGSFTRYKGKQGGSDVPNWLEMNRAGPVVVDRKTGERRTIYVERAAVSVTGGIQPDVLARAMSSELIEAGLLARLLLCMPPQTPKRWSEAEVDSGTEQLFNDLLDRLLALDFDNAEGDGRRLPRTLQLSPAAKNIWVSWYNVWAKEQTAVEGSLAAAYSKLEAYSARFALLNFIVDHPDAAEGEIQAENMEAGISLARWFCDEARRVYAMLAETPAERDGRRLEEFIRSRPGQEITAADLSRSNPHRYPDSAAAHCALDVLAQAKCGEWIPRPAGPRGGRPSEVFRLVRRAYETYETSAVLQNGASANGHSDRG
jgi:hypothetical protein